MFLIYLIYIFFQITNNNIDSYGQSLLILIYSWCHLILFIFLYILKDKQFEKICYIIFTHAIIMFRKFTQLEITGINMMVKYPNVFRNSIYLKVNILTENTITFFFIYRLYHKTEVALHNNLVSKSILSH